MNTGNVVDPIINLRVKLVLASEKLSIDIHSVDLFIHGMGQFWHSLLNIIDII